MDIQQVNAIGTTNQINSYPAPKPAPAESGDTVQPHVDTVQPRDDPAVLDVSKLEIFMNAEDGGKTKDFLQEMIEKVNRRLSGTNREFDYSFHEKTQHYVIKIIDRETKEVIREIPPEKTLDALARMWDMMGIFVDDKT